MDEEDMIRWLLEFGSEVVPLSVLGTHNWAAGAFIWLEAARGGYLIEERNGYRLNMEKFNEVVGQDL